jgi:hypothetical protein
LLTDGETLWHVEPLVLEMARGHLGGHHLVPAVEVFDLLLHLIYDVHFKVLVKIVFFQEDFGETLQSEIRLVLVPEEDFFEAFAFDFDVDFNGHEAAELVLRLVEQGVVFEAIVWALEQVEL